jgi:hypothetical protein
MVAGMTVLENTRINGVFQGLLDPRTLPQRLLFSERVKESPAEDGDIMARFIGYIQIADLVADDQKAAVYSSGKFQFEETNIPNLKVGQAMLQSQINQWLAIKQNGGITNDKLGLFQNAETRLLANVRTGVAYRKEALIAGMMMDSMNYNRLGIKLTGATWGMPADLKVTTAVAWTDATNATPINDILGVQLVGRIRYGVVYDRVTMSTAAFRLAINTLEFQAKARTFLAPNVSFVNLALANLDQQKALASNILGMTIEFNDARYQTQDAAGNSTLLPFWDLNAVSLSVSAFDGDTSIWDFANGVVSETVVAALMGEPIAGGPSLGPIAYATAPENWNPPNITYWGVQRGFPRKHLLQANACLRVGYVPDTIAPSAPF